MTVLSQVDIKRLLPHRHPMLLVDAVVDLLPGRRLTAVKNITAAEACYAGLPDDCPPDAYAYPHSLVCESFGQSACILMAASVPEEVRAGHVVLFGSLADVEISTRAYPGEQLRHEVQLTAVKGTLGFFTGYITVGDRMIARVDRGTLALRPVANLTAGR